MTTIFYPTILIEIIKQLFVFPLYNYIFIKIDQLYSVLCGLSIIQLYEYYHITGSGPGKFISDNTNCPCSCSRKGDQKREHITEETVDRRVLQHDKSEQTRKQRYDHTFDFSAQQRSQTENHQPCIESQCVKQAC